MLFLAVLSAACGRAATPGPEPGTVSPGRAPGPKDVVAEVDGQKITAEELDRHAAGQLQQLRDQEYEIRKNALEDLIVRKLVKKQADARGISEPELMRMEVDQKVARPTEAEVRDLYDRNRDRVGGRSRAEVAPQIESSLLQQRTAERAQAFTRELRDNASVRIALPQPRTDVAVPAGAPVQGPADAPVTIVEYSDYLCPYCQRAEEAVARVLARHQGKVRFVHRDFLIGRPRSMAVAKAALCAGDQGKFWEYRRSLLTTSGDWTDQDLAARAAGLALRVEDFRTCLASDRHEQDVSASSEEGHRLGVTGTPTFFINGRRMTGMRSEKELDEVIQSELRGRG